jgi:hypothetical protein
VSTEFAGNTPQFSTTADFLVGKLIKFTDRKRQMEKLIERTADLHLV